jgi:hypothetical protein
MRSNIGAVAQLLRDWSAAGHVCADTEEALAGEAEALLLDLSDALALLRKAEWVRLEEGEPPVCLHCRVFASEHASDCALGAFLGLRPVDANEDANV